MGQDYSNQEIRVSFTATLPAPVLFADLLLFQVWVHRGWNHAMVTALRVRSNLWGSPPKWPPPTTPLQAPSGFPMSDFQWPETAEEGPVPAAEITCHFGPCSLAHPLMNPLITKGMSSLTVASPNPAASIARHPGFELQQQLAAPWLSRLHWVHDLHSGLQKSCSARPGLKLVAEISAN